VNRKEALLEFNESLSRNLLTVNSSPVMLDDPLIYVAASPPCPIRYYTLLDDNLLQSVFRLVDRGNLSESNLYYSIYYTVLSFLSFGIILLNVQVPLQYCVNAPSGRNLYPHSVHNGKSNPFLAQYMETLYLRL
jgi:hypothetical protein